MKIPSYITYVYLTKFGKQIRKTAKLEEFVLADRFPGIVFVAKPIPGSKTILWDISTRKLEAPNLQNGDAHG